MASDELGEGSPVHEELAQAVVLVGRSVAPLDPVRLGERGDLVDPQQKPAVASLCHRPIVDEAPFSSQVDSRERHDTSGIGRLEIASRPVPGADGEIAAIETIRRGFRQPPAGETWIGDDAAVVAGPPGELLLAADVVVEGVHFDLGLVEVADVGWKALAVNVSDIAAMAGRPLHALVTVSGASGAMIEGLVRGLAAASEAYGCAVVGGDLSAGPCLVVSVAVTGTTVGVRAVLRSGARDGDSLFVTGRSAVGGRAQGASGPARKRRARAGCAGRRLPAPDWLASPRVKRRGQPGRRR